MKHLLEVGRRHALGAAAVVALLVIPADVLATTISFDSAPAEAAAGIVNQARAFTFQGSTWSGGQVAVVGDTAIYHSGVFAYMTNPPFGNGMATVSFVTPADPTSVTFAFMHGGNFSNIPPGVARAFDVAGNLLAEIMSVPGAGPASPLLSFSTTTPIARIDFVNATVDTFSFELLPVPEAPALAQLLTAAFLLGARARMRTRPTV